MEPNNLELNDKITVPVIIDAMKQINKTGSKIYRAGSILDYGVSLDSPCSNEQLEELENCIGYKLPADYRQFLLLTNGLRLSSLFVSSRFFCLEELYSVRASLTPPPCFLTIGTCADATIDISINLDDNDFSNIYTYDIMGDVHFNRLNCGFCIFLDRFITTYGSTFWEWTMEKTEINQFNNE